MNKEIWKKGDKLSVEMVFEAACDSDEMGGEPGGHLIMEIKPGKSLERWDNEYFVNLTEAMKARNGIISVQKLASKQFEFPTEPGSVVKAGGLLFMLDEEGNWGNLDGQWSERDIRETAIYTGEEIELIH